MFPYAVLSHQSCVTLCDPLDCTLQGSSVYGIFQVRILKWVAIFFSRGSSWFCYWTHVSYICCIANNNLSETRIKLIASISLPWLELSWHAGVAMVLKFNWDLLLSMGLGIKNSLNILYGLRNVLQVVWLNWGKYQVWLL